uniref:Putative tick defensin n=1 Tax=Rhipicephalus pulchellus TaxID=72859 RepID=L7MA54_RHIPC
MKISSTLCLLATVTVFAVIIFGTVMAAPKEHHRWRRAGSCTSNEECKAKCPPNTNYGCILVQEYCLCGKKRS